MIQFYLSTCDSEFKVCRLPKLWVVSLLWKKIHLWTWLILLCICHGMISYCMLVMWGEWGMFTVKLDKCIQKVWYTEFAILNQFNFVFRNALLRQNNIQYMNNRSKASCFQPYCLCMPPCVIVMFVYCLMFQYWSSPFTIINCGMVSRLT